MTNVISHPVLSDLLTHLRDKQTPSSTFRSLLAEISRFLAYETARFLPTQWVDLTTPLEQTKSLVIAQEIVIVSILRAGAGMLDGFLQTLPQARVGHIGIYRDKFLNNTIEYYLRMPEKIQGQPVFVLDPLLATGSTAVAALSRIKEFKVGDIHLVCLLAAPQGIKLLKQHHSDVTIHTLSIERDLDDHGFILPGIGDAGGRLYGTEYSCYCRWQWRRQNNPGQTIASCLGRRALLHLIARQLLP